jgi:hypothetical protein
MSIKLIFPICYITEAMKGKRGFFSSGLDLYSLLRTRQKISHLPIRASVRYRQHIGSLFSAYRERRGAFGQATTVRQSALTPNVCVIPKFERDASGSMETGASCQRVCMLLSRRQQYFATTRTST